MAQGADDPLNTCLRFMFPHGSVPRSTWYGPSAELSWLSLPNPRTPRILVPTSPARATGRAIMRVSAAIDAPERLARRVASGVMSTGLGSAYPGRVVIDEAGPGSLVDYLAERFGEPVSVALSVGPARGNLKIVLAVYDRAGEPVAFVKVGYPDNAIPHVLRETASFRVLDTKQFTRLDVPRLLFADSWHGYPVLAITPLRDPARQVRRARERLPLSAMAELANTFASPPVRLEDLPAWRRLRLQAESGATSERFVAVMEQLHERYGDQVVRPTAWHGDWAPWNMGWGRDRVTLWDWERFEEGVPSGFDAFHYAIFSISGVAGFTRSSIELGLERVRAATKPTTAHHRMLADLYLATLLGRHLEAVGEFAQVSANIADLLLLVLEDSLSGSARLR